MTLKLVVSKILHSKDSLTKTSKGDPSSNVMVDGDSDGIRVSRFERSGPLSEVDGVGKSPTLEGLGLSRIGVGALVSSRKGDSRRSRQSRGLGLGDLEGLSGKKGMQTIPVIENLRDLKLA